MAVTIRLARIGKKHVPFYRLVAIGSRKKRDGKFIDNIGTYDPLKGLVVKFDKELYEKWVSHGAVVSDAAKKIYRLYKKSGSIAMPSKSLSKESTPEVAVVAEKS